MLHIVLYEPEIPQNTGNIMRTCVAINAHLHLIEPLGFDLSDKNLKRSHLDYLTNLTYTVYPHLAAFSARYPSAHICYLSRYGQKPYSDIQYDSSQDIFLMFGKESTGIKKTILADHLSTTYRIPTSEHVRSLNLSNCVALVAFELLRQTNFAGLSATEPVSLKGPDFLKTFLTENNDKIIEATKSLKEKKWKFWLSTVGVVPSSLV